ncbi:TolC family protein [Lampropedia puyangensis]|uniref:TolC family protein n=1 Tax=Lampropedia puyangensis TaxID=1330072 RepID=A0A4S8EYG1_9BURK|nr:TolC family protein [Lampropedia puyangensis]THT99969.1 TolC family protein [Lampropedia puyangensis]
MTPHFHAPLHLPLRAPLGWINHWHASPQEKPSQPAKHWPSMSIWLAVALLCPGMPAVAQTQTDTTTSLQLAQRLTANSLASNSTQQHLLNALQDLVETHPDILKAKAALEASGHDLSTAERARWPSFKIGTNSGSVDRSSGKENYNAINAEVRMSLIDGGAISAGVRSAQFQQAAQANIVQGTRENTLLDALTALLELQRYEQKADIAAESARIIEQLARIEERRAELGAVGRNDLRQAFSRQASARAQALGLQAQRSDALARFTRYYSFSPQSGWLPALAVPLQWLPISEAQAQQQSEANSVELQEIAQQIAKAEAEVERSEAQRLPTLEAVVGHTYDPKGVLYNDGTRFGLEVNWNFGNGFELRDRIRKAVNELQSQKAQQDAVQRQVREATSSSWGRVQAGRERANQLQDAVAQARAAFEGRRRLLEAGRGSLSQVLDAQLDMQNLMLEQIDAQQDQHINELQLVRTTGALLPTGSSAMRLNQLFQQSDMAANSTLAPARTTSAPKPSVASPTPMHHLPALQLRVARQLQPLSGPRTASWW